MSLMTQKQYAERRGVSPQYINKLVGQGKIRTIGRKVDTRQADSAIQAWSRSGRVLPAKRKAKARLKAKPVPKRASRAIDSHLAVPVLPRDSATKKLTAARAQREHYQAELAKLEYEKAVGNLLPREHVLAAERLKNGNIRTLFRQLGRSLAPVLARTASEAEAERILTDAIDRILERLAQDPLAGEITAPIAPKPEEIPAPAPMMASAAAAVAL